MTIKNLSRRQFLRSASAGTIAAAAYGAIPAFGKDASKPAILGGQKAVNKNFPWPKSSEAIEKAVMATCKRGKWYRHEGRMVNTFEKKFAEANGMKRCVATGSGTQAIHCGLYAVGVDAGDEVLVPPYTFIASINPIILLNALPVFVDIDYETFQMDPAKMKEKINGNTRAVEPVHIAGLSADMDRINEIAKRHNLGVVEDACQALFTEYKGRKCGTMSDIGCFSFQSSKILPCGEGGAAIGNNEELMNKFYSFHTLGVETGTGSGDRRRWTIPATKYRMNEFEASVLLPQLESLEETVNRRNRNAEYLTSKLKDIPGIIPQKHYEGQGKATYYLYEFRYKKEHFNNLSLEGFVKALDAEGVGTFCQGRYELNKEPVIENMLNSRTFRKIFSKARLKRYREENECPNNAKRSKESAGIWHWSISGTKEDIDDVYNAILKIYENRDELSKAKI